MAVRDSVQKVLDLDRQLQEKKQSTITELLGERGEIDTALKALGYDGTTKKKAPTQNQPKSPCKICKSTDHDGRFHRRKEAAPVPSQKSEKPPPPPVKTAQPAAAK